MAKGNYAERRLRLAEPMTEELGPLSMLPGLWKNDGDFQGRGWNLIALPFFEEGQFRDYRLLKNHYDEELRFTFVDDRVPNRGVDQHPGATTNTDQLVVALDYQQTIQQRSARDFPVSGLAGDAGLDIHHEPGLFLHMKNFRTNDLDVARLATIPHGNAATAIGRSLSFNSAPTIPDEHGFPVGVSDDIVAAVDAATGETDYLRPYKHFTDEPFTGDVPDPTFAGFSPANANRLLQLGVAALDVEHTVELSFDTSLEDAGITNIPFIEAQADASFMKATFWIMKLADSDELVLAYTQFIFLDFFPRVDGQPGLIRWPHISINMMRKATDPSPDDPYMLNKSNILDPTA